MILRCENPHPQFPKQECGAVQSLKLEGDYWGEGTISVECRRCGGWVDFQFSGTKAVVNEAVLV